MGYKPHGEGMDGGIVDWIAQVGASSQFLGNQGVTGVQVTTENGQKHGLVGMKVLLWVGGESPQHWVAGATSREPEGQVGLQGHILGMGLAHSITDVPAGLSLT